jgi:lactoylglutathione lyase
MSAMLLVPLLQVSSMEQSVRYYVDGLGFTMKDKWVVEGELRWCWLERDGAALMLQGPYTLAGEAGKGVSLNFQCEDALAIYRELKFRGIEVSEPFVGNSMWVAGLIDPDGYRLFFHSPTDVPEETTLSTLS